VRLKPSDIKTEYDMRGEGPTAVPWITVRGHGQPLVTSPLIDFSFVLGTAGHLAEDAEKTLSPVVGSEPAADIGPKIVKEIVKHVFHRLHLHAADAEVTVVPQDGKFMVGLKNFEEPYTIIMPHSDALALARAGFEDACGLLAAHGAESLRAELVRILSIMTGSLSIITGEEEGPGNDLMGDGPVPPEEPGGTGPSPRTPAP